MHSSNMWDYPGTNGNTGFLKKNITCGPKCQTDGRGRGQDCSLKIKKERKFIGLGQELFKEILYLSLMSMEDEKCISIGYRRVCLEADGNTKKESL